MSEDLADQNVKTTGAVRENRTLDATKKMKTLKELKKPDRGSFDFCSDGKVYFCRWNDSTVVNIGNNYSSYLPVKTVKCRMKRDSSVSITQPQLIKKYNLGMGGVDVMNRLFGSYRPTIRGKKWYWPVAINAISISVIAAWRVQCAVQEKPKTHLEFRREIKICLFKMAMPLRLQIGGGRIPHLPNDIRCDGVDIASAAQGRCKACQKKHSLHLSEMQRATHSDKNAVYFGIHHTPLMFIFLKDTKLLTVLKSRGLYYVFQYFLNNEVHFCCI